MTNTPPYTKEYLLRLNQGGNNLLMFAIHEHGNIKFILDTCRGVNVLKEALQQNNNNNESALTYAARFHPTAVEHILNACRDAGVLKEALQHQNKYGENALMIAAYNDPEAVEHILNACRDAGVLKEALQQKGRDRWDALTKAATSYPEVVKPIFDACESTGILDDVLRPKNCEGETVFEIAAKCLPEAIPELVNAVVSTNALTLNRKLALLSKYTNETPEKAKAYLNWEVKLDKLITDLSGMKLNKERKDAVSMLKGYYETYQGSEKKAADLNAFYKDSVTLLSKILREDKKATIQGAQINRDDERTWSQFILLVVACLFVITIPVIAIAGCCFGNPSKAGIFSSQSQYRRTLTQYTDVIGAPDAPTTQGKPLHNVESEAEVVPAPPLPAASDENIAAGGESKIPGNIGVFVSDEKPKPSAPKISDDPVGDSGGRGREENPVPYRR